MLGRPPLRAGFRVVALAAAHFLVAFGAALTAYGADLDRLRSRSALSRAGGAVYDVLWFPHDAVIRALPPGALHRPGVVPAVLVGHSLAWGLALALLWGALRRLRRVDRRLPRAPDA